MTTLAEPDYVAEMRLPDGKTCDECVHARRCFGLGFSTPGNTSCDFWPRRYVERVLAAPDNKDPDHGTD